MARSRLLIAGSAAMGAGALVLSLAGATPAGASGPSSAAQSTAGQQLPLVTPSAAVTPTTEKSQGLAGYGFSSTGTITSFDATIVVPTLACPPTGAYASDISAQLVGTIGGGSFLYLKCATGTASYQGVVGISQGGASKDFAVSSGDTVETQLTVTTSGGSTTVQAVVTDTTSSTVTKKVVTKKKVLVETKGWAILQDVGGAATNPIPPFGTLQWSSVTVNGGTLQSANPVKYNLYNSVNKELVSTSAIAGTGNAFTNKFQHSS